MQTLTSFIQRFQIQLIRFADHLYRHAIGLPQFARSEITPSIYVGGQYSKRGVIRMQAVGITAVVNMRESPIPEYTELNNMKKLHLATTDLRAPSIDDLKKGITFIEKEVKKGGKVYIHCRLGEGRGPTMAAAYLMSTGLSLEDAIKTIQDVRPFISITKHQMEQLRKLEAITQREVVGSRL